MCLDWDNVLFKTNPTQLARDLNWDQKPELPVVGVR